MEARGAYNSDVPWQYPPGGLKKKKGITACGRGGGAASVPGGTARSMPAERGIDRGAGGRAYAARPGGPRHEGQKHDGQKHGHKHFKHRRHFSAFAFGAPYLYDYAYYDDDCWRMRYIGGAWRRVWACSPRY